MSEFPAADMKPRGILMTNLSPATARPAIEDFLSFCGPIEHVRFRAAASPAGTQECVVIFENADARGTAVLLSDSTIDGNSIVISPVVPDNFGGAEEAGAVSAGGEGIEPVAAEKVAVAAGSMEAFFAKLKEAFKSGPPSVEEVREMSKESFAEAKEFAEAMAKKTVAMMDSAEEKARARTLEFDPEVLLASIKGVGTAAGENTREFITHVDTQYKISDQVGKVQTEGSRSIQEIDNSYKISESSSAMLGTVQAKAAEVDAQLQISKRALETKQSVTKGFEKVMENPEVQKGVKQVQDGWEQLVNSTTQMAANLMGTAPAAAKADGKGPEEEKEEEAPVIDSDNL
eukprot:CAMPEP_0174898818 /NCGR_PEP_ID=MMETSP0167-20121228/23881_1 /TAXON_ID=38298 /ORGANISM="Rhodella maculata, Strain CCMP736" /LENGTH=344 /DNA_ID=CAMNT_0016139577 /DNA_START=5 /DNA_END=1039 /DNA_ORIENTATION=+